MDQSLQQVTPLTLIHLDSKSYKTNPFGTWQSQEPDRCKHQLPDSQPGSNDSLWDITPLRGGKPKAEPSGSTGASGSNTWDDGSKSWYGGCNTWDGGSNWYDSHWDESIGDWKYTPKNLNDTFDKNASATTGEISFEQWLMDGQEMEAKTRFTDVPATTGMVGETPCDQWLQDQEALESMNDIPVGGECEGGEEEGLLESDPTVEPQLDMHATPPEEKQDEKLGGTGHKPKQVIKKRPAAASSSGKAPMDEHFGGDPDEAKPWVMEMSSGSVGTKHDKPITWGPISKVAAVHFQQSVFGVQAIDFHSFSLKDLIAYTKTIDYVALDCCKDAPGYVGKTIGYIGWLWAEWHVDGLADVAYWLMEESHPKLSFMVLWPVTDLPLENYQNKTAYCFQVLPQEDVESRLRFEGSILAGSHWWRGQLKPHCSLMFHHVPWVSQAAKRAVPVISRSCIKVVLPKILHHGGIKAVKTWSCSVRRFTSLLKYKKSKAGYDIAVPNVAGALTSHLLPDHVIQKVVNTKQYPMNPHKQRLLVAEAKQASTVESKKKKPQVGKGKAPKSKAKAKATPTDTDSSTSRSAYSAAKKSFMDKLLDLCNPYIYGSFKDFSTYDRQLPWCNHGI